MKTPPVSRKSPPPPPPPAKRKSPSPSSTRSRQSSPSATPSPSRKSSPSPAAGQRSRTTGTGSRSAPSAPNAGTPSRASLTPTPSPSASPSPLGSSNTASRGGSNGTQVGSGRYNSGNNNGNVVNSGSLSYTDNSIHRVTNTAVSNVHINNGASAGPTGATGPGGYMPPRQGNFPSAPNMPPNGAFPAGSSGMPGHAGGLSSGRPDGFGRDPGATVGSARANAAAGANQDFQANTRDLPNGGYQVSSSNGNTGASVSYTADQTRVNATLPNGRQLTVNGPADPSFRHDPTNPSHPVPAGLNASPIDTLVRANQASSQLQTNLNNLSPDVRNGLTQYTQHMQSDPAKATSYLDSLPAGQREQIQGAYQAQQRQGELTSALDKTRAGLTHNLTQSERAALADLQRSMGVDVTQNPTFNDALSTLTTARGRIDGFGPHRDRINGDVERGGLRGVNPGDRDAFTQAHTLDAGYRNLTGLMNNQIYGQNGTAMKPDQIQQVNQLNGALNADRSHLPSNRQYDDGVVRVAGTRENELGGIQSFNQGIMAPLQSGQVHTMADAVRMAQTRNLTHGDGLQQSMVSSNNLDRMNGQWDTRQNAAMAGQRGVMVAYNSQDMLRQPTSDFIRNMQSTYGLNLGTNAATGHPNTMADVERAIAEGRSGQFGNFHLVNPRSEADMRNAFASMNGYRERMAYIGAHGFTGQFSPGMSAQRGLQGANEGRLDFGSFNMSRQQLQDATRGFNGFMFMDTCTGGSFVNNTAPRFGDGFDQNPAQFA